MKKLFMLSLCFVAFTMFGKDIYVSKTTGKNSNKGTKEKPYKNLQKALKKAKKGDKIYVAEGNYYGMRDKGFIEMIEPVEIYGGWSTDFSKRDILKHKTLIQPDNKTGKKTRKALMIVTKSKKGDKVVIDGLMFDMGNRNSYSDKKGKPEGVDTGMLLLPPQFNKIKDKSPTVIKQCLTVQAKASAGDLIVRNNMFLNCSSYGIQAGHKQGEVKIINNVFVANRMAAVDVYGTGGKKGPKGPTKKDGNVEFAYNTVVFTWSRLKDMLDMGYGFRVMTKLSYNIHHNIFACNIFTGIDNTRFNRNEWLKIDNNALFLNKRGDLQYAEESNSNEYLKADDFGDLEFASITGNSGKIIKLPFNKKYLEGYLNARYSEQADFDPNSSANQFRAAMGMNKQGKLKTKVSMFANRYPLEDAIKLFGADKKGAQLPKK